MIRVEVVIKSQHGYALGTSSENRLKQVIAGAVLNECVGQNHEIVRVQFLGPPPKKRRS